MNIENNIDNILNQLINRGCEIEYLKELRCKTLEIVKNKINFNNIMNDLVVYIFQILVIIVNIN